VSGLLAKRTNINDNDRQPKILGGPTGTNWETKFTEFDVAIGYALLDQWARYPDFAQRYMKAVYRAIALDRMTIGWYGQSAAVESDGSTNTLGEDVNIGWLTLLETQNSGNLMTEGAAVGEITIGSKAGNDYANLDAMVYDLLSGIPVEHRTGNEVAIVGSALVADDMNKALSKNGHTPSEKGLGITNLANSYGGLSSVQVPRFPDTGVVVTDPSNLHLYFQESGTRRNTEEESKRNRVVDYISSNDAYALGNKNAITAVKAENVKIVNG
jgi:P2 family phage major capsid protein